MFKIVLKCAPSKRKRDSFAADKIHLYVLDLRTFVANSALSQLRAFWGALFAQIWWVGAQKHFIGPGQNHTS